MIGHALYLSRICFVCCLSRAGRELSKLAIAWQAAAYGSDPASFTPDLMASVTDVFIQQKVLFFVFILVTPACCLWFCCFDVLCRRLLVFLKTSTASSLRPVRHSMVY